MTKVKCYKMDSRPESFICDWLNITKTDDFLYLNISTSFIVQFYIHLTKKPFVAQNKTN